VFAGIRLSTGIHNRKRDCLQSRSVQCRQRWSVLAVHRGSIRFSRWADVSGVFRTVFGWSIRKFGRHGEPWLLGRVRSGLLLSRRLHIVYTKRVCHGSVQHVRLIRVHRLRSRSLRRAARDGYRQLLRPVSGGPLRQRLWPDQLQLQQRMLPWLLLPSRHDLDDDAGVCRRLVQHRGGSCVHQMPARAVQSPRRQLVHPMCGWAIRTRRRTADASVQRPVLSGWVGSIAAYIAAQPLHVAVMSACSCRLTAFDRLLR
jgi:hypothetical protein